MFLPRGCSPRCTAPPPRDDDEVINALQSELDRLELALSGNRLELALSGNHRRAAHQGGEIDVPDVSDVTV